MPNINELEEDIKDLQYELNVVLEALLLQTGVHEDFINEAVDEYIDCIDDIQGDSPNQALNAAAYIKTNFPQYFKKREILKESRKHEYNKVKTKE